MLAVRVSVFRVRVITHSDAALVIWVVVHVQGNNAPYTDLRRTEHKA